jgi:hypothetical protein
MPTTSVKEIERNRSINAELTHAAETWIHALPIGRAVCRFPLGGGT